MALPPLPRRSCLTTDPGADLTVVSRESRQRPRSCPESSSRKRQVDVLQSLLHKLTNGGGGSVLLRQAFRASNAKGEERISREALYHVLCNYLTSLTRKQFNHLLNQLGLSTFKSITFNNFISCVPGSTAHSRPHTSRPRTTFLSLRGEANISQVTGQVLEKCKQLDTHHTGKLIPDQLRAVLRSFGIPVTPAQLTELCQSLGYKEGGLVDYTVVLTHFTLRSKSGIIHSKLTDKQQRFHVDEPKRACTSMGDAETRLITVLNSQFLKILAAFKSHDRRGRGYVPRDVFLSVLYSHADGSDNPDDIESIAEKLSDNNWVPYPKFLALFEHAPSSIRPPTVITPHKEPGQLMQCLHDIVSSKGAEVTQVFHSLDPGNTGRLTLAMTTELLERFGVCCSQCELEVVWRSLLRNRDNTVQFQEFMRHFTDKPSSAERRPHLTDDHHFMLSKNLHRDEDMVAESILSTLRLHQSPLLKQLTPHDPLNTGTLPTHTFLECVSSVCPDLSRDKLQLLHERLGDTVSYHRLLSKPRHNPYRHGSNMSSVMAHKPPTPSLTDTHAPSVLSARPPYGLSGVKVHLQRQLVKNWRTSRRLFRDVDRGRTGRVGVGELWGVLAQCGVELTTDDQFHILELLDPQLKGTVDYNHLIGAVFEQQ
ncbi:EF-hand calcium-binding domain-containing protein 6-like [Halichondria panicea]|uniref:EF-hand calcium-binding domain-containing protein 6-like n=1 Tax=Halichondria panicea TaxID=6063 RepID=UPI00312B55C8